MMEIIKRQININNIEIGNKFYFKINLNQSINNLGMMTDMPYGSNTILMGNYQPIQFINDYDLEPYIKTSGRIVAGTDSKLNRVKSYDANEPYKTNFDIRRETYVNYSGITIDGVDRVTKINEDEVSYTINARRDALLGTSGQTSGILYIDNPIDSTSLPIELSVLNTTTKVQYIGEGWNETNLSIDPQIQEEFLIGINSPPEVKSDVFIDRGVINVLDKHLRLSEIKNLDHLTRYGNGFYNISKI